MWRFFKFSLYFAYLCVKENKTDTNKASGGSKKDKGSDDKSKDAKKDEDKVWLFRN